MNFVGLVAEFNPFHNGHQYLINTIKDEINPDGIVAVMSGDFTQRGYPALTDKWSRARSAVAAGVDLVIELPTVFALSSAQDFAYGGIKILESLGCINHLAFGSECADIDLLSKIASMDLKDNPQIKTLLDTGMSYASAISTVIGQDLQPNDILAVEYLKANTKLIPHAIKRKGLGHIATATYIRENLGEIENFVPEESLYEIQEWPFWDEISDQKLFEMIRYALMIKPDYELANIMNISEGFENALKKAIVTSNSFEELLSNVKSKRYTYTRISRALMCIALNMEKFLIDEAKSQNLYARVLAFNEKGAAILKEAKKTSSIDIISNLKKAEVLVSKYKNIIETDVQASDLYSILTGREVYDYSDFVQAAKLE